MNEVLASVMVVAYLALLCGAYQKGWKDRGEQEATFARIDELKRIEQEHQKCLAKQETPEP